MAKKPRKTKGRYKAPDTATRCAGTVDFIGYLHKLNDELWVLDWKSAKDDYPEYRMQTAKYREMYGRAARNGIVLLDKETGFPRFVDHSDTYLQDVQRFNCLLEYWYHTYSDRLKDGYVPSPTEVLKILDKPALIWWAVNCMRDKLFELHDQHDFKGRTISPETFTEWVEDARKNFRKVSTEAMDIGSKVHELIEAYLRTGVEPTIEDDRVLSAFIAFLEFKEEYGLEPVELEKTVYL